MKFNPKAFWREILIAILISMLIWVSSSEPTIVRTGSSDTTCITDTLTKPVPGATIIRYTKVKVAVTDTVRITDHQITTLLDHKIDTAWLYSDIPVQEYNDDAFYVRTIGWLDSISVYVPKSDLPKNGKSLPSLHVNTQIGAQHIAPGVMLQHKKVQVGYNYNIIQGSGNVTLGWKIF